MHFSIGKLLDHPVAIPQVAGWHCRQWARLMPEYTCQSYRQFLETHYRRDGVPVMFAAIAEGQVIGTIALDDEDMATHPELSPWLASLYVDGPYRSRGVATALVRHAVKEAVKLGIPQLYLYTPDRESFFLALGWKTVLREDYNGVPVTIMALDINALQKPRPGTASPV